MKGKPLDLSVIIGISAAVLIGCAATWIVMEVRLRHEREELEGKVRQEISTALKDNKGEVSAVVAEGVKKAADEVISADYVTKKITEEADKVVKDPPVDAAAHVAADAAETGIKGGAKAATGMVDAVKKHEKEIHELGNAAAEAARVGFDALLDAAGHFMQGPPAPPAKDAKDKGDKKESKENGESK